MCRLAPKKFNSFRLGNHTVLHQAVELVKDHEIVLILHVPELLRCRFVPGTVLFECPQAFNGPSPPFVDAEELLKL